jgi:uncharacterized membrane protein
MAQFCSACGGQMADGASTCPACGKAVGVGGGAAAQMAPAPAASSGNDNIIALLCYSPVAIVGIILGLAVEPYKSSKLVKFHAFQSLFTCIALFVIFFGLGIVGSVLSAVFAPLALVMIPIWFVMWIGSIVLAIFMMIKAYKGEMTKLPIVGEFASKQAGV